ncbi:hypothetical protein IHMA87_00189 [Pseudomonas paraeruginosa]|nr:hypothetical protein IHMA87_00189 [Pseudomonas aeruginosa]
MALSTRDRDEVLSQSNVTPLVDALLLVFIVTAPLLISSIPINLPKTESIAPPERFFCRWTIRRRYPPMAGPRMRAHRSRRLPALCLGTSQGCPGGGASGSLASSVPSTSHSPAQSSPNSSLGCWVRLAPLPQPIDCAEQ